MRSTIYNFVHTYYIFLLTLILLFAFTTRVWRLSIPSGYMFDEVYHALTAKLMANNDPRAYEWWHTPVEPGTAIEWTHPPLAKLIQAAGIKVMGENSFGWRISSVVFGVGTVGLVSLIALHLFQDKVVSVLSAFLFSLEGLVVTQSRIAMNDIHLTFFILFTFFFYLEFKEALQKKEQWKKYLILSGLGIGLTIATKWSGILILGVLLGDQLFEMLKNRPKNVLNQIAIFTFAWIVVPLFVYTLSYSQMFLQGKGYAHFKELTSQMWWYHSRLEATHPYQSTPLQWVTNMRPVWFYVDYSNSKKASNIYAQSNSVLVWSGLLSVTLIIVKTLFSQGFFKIEEKNKILTFSLNFHHYMDPLRLLLMSYFIFWVPYIFSPRIMFFYHYLPAIPFLTIILSYSLLHISKKSNAGQYIAGLVILFTICNFILFFPNWTGLPVNKQLQKEWYQLFSSWK